MRTLGTRPRRARRRAADGRGRGTVHTQFLTEDIVDELQLVVAPVFVGDSEAPRFVRDGRFPWNPSRRATLVDARRSATWCSCATRSRRGSQARTDDDATAHRHDPDPGRPAAAVRRRIRDEARVFSFDGLVDGREHLAFGARRLRAPRRATRRAAARAPAQRVPHRRRVRQPALRLRTAAARGRRAHRRRRRLPALPAAGGPRHRALLQARRLRAAGPGLDTYEANLALGSRRGRAQLRRRRADAAGARGPGSRCSATTPTRRGSSAVRRKGGGAGANRSACRCSERPLPGGESASGQAPARPPGPA